jgi:hypothetical protein
MNTPLIPLIEEDLEIKRELAIFLAQNDYKKYQVFASEIKNLNDEQFTNLYIGNTDYNKFNSSNPALFKEYVQKFEDNIEIIDEWYDKKNYYTILAKLWKSNCISNLKGKDPEEQEKILKNHGIDTNDWDSDFRDHFKSVIVKSLNQEQIAKRLKNYIEADLGDFDEYIKTNVLCKQDIEENEKSVCGMYLKQNLDINMYKLMKTVFPLFLEKYQKDFDLLSSDLKQKQEGAAKKKMIKSGMTESKSKKVLEEIMKKYEKEKYTGDYIPDKGLQKGKGRCRCNPIRRLEKVKETAVKFKNGKLNELTFKDKADAFLSNKMIKHAALGLSIMNLSYGILHLTQTFLYEDEVNKELSTRLERIRDSFEKHKNNVRQTLPEDVDEAAEYIKKLNADFNSDLEEVRQLIRDIKEAISSEKTEEKKSIGQLIASVLGGGGNAVAAFLCKNKSDQIEYATSSIFNWINLIINGADIAKARENIKKLEDSETKANELRLEIEAKIKDLREQFDNLKTAHFAIK